MDFYTEVQDLHHLLPLVDTSFKTNKYSELNERIVDVVEEFGLVSFETLAVEVRFKFFLDGLGIIRKEREGCG